MIVPSGSDMALQLWDSRSFRAGTMSRLAREQQHLAQARLVEARRLGVESSVLRKLAGEGASLQVRADYLHSAAEALLPKT
jgi:hypothetical protein